VAEPRHENPEEHRHHDVPAAEDGPLGRILARTFHAAMIGRMT
jgi:hypothetical protein